jgi:hypothetical protein
LCGRHRRTQKTGQSEDGSRSSSHYTRPGDTHPGGDMTLSLGRKHDGIGLNPGLSAFFFETLVIFELRPLREAPSLETDFGAELVNG